MNSANPILVNTYRGKMVESFHRGAFCVIQGNKIIHAQGNIEALIYPRSALKFFQILPLLLLGGKKIFNFSNAEITVMCASHSAEQYHLKLVKSILKKIDVSSTCLLCGAHLPMSEKESQKLIKTGQKPTSLHNNCSGKHAGFLALAKILNTPLDNYLHPESNVQMLIKNTMSDFFDYDLNSQPSAIDGCSAPVYAMPLKVLAAGFQRISEKSARNEPYQIALPLLKSAIIKHPRAIAGKMRYDTELMKAGNGNILAKVGAEGIFGITCLKENIGIAIKIDDGKMFPQYSVAQQILNDLGVLTAKQSTKLNHWKDSEILNWNKIVTGKSIPNFNLSKSN